MPLSRAIGCRCPSPRSRHGRDLCSEPHGGVGPESTLDAAVHSYCASLGRLGSGIQDHRRSHFTLDESGLFSAGLVPLVFVMLFSKGLPRPRKRRKRRIASGLATGVLGGTGNIALYLALGTGGPASVVVPIAGLAPLITIVLALLILKESINRMQIAGLGLALISIYLLSI